MSERELFHHIKNTFIPQKGTALFFDLRNYHLCGLQPKLLRSKEEVQHYCFDLEPDSFRCILSHFGKEIFYDFSCKEFHRIENLTTHDIPYHKSKQPMDIEQVKKEFAELIAFLKSQGS